MQVIRKGAEAEIRKGVWMNREAVFKSRIPKNYRHVDLDAELRMSRTRNEARLMQEARRMGVPTPIIYDINLSAAEIVMQFLPGPRVKDLMDGNDQELKSKLSREIGRLVALLHQGGMTHGDLTTSNMIYHQDRIWFIDFSLGGKNAEIEDMGVDLHLLKEAFQSAHSEVLGLYDEILSSYQQNYRRGAEVVRKIHDIEDRGRYS